MVKKDGKIKIRSMGIYLPEKVLTNLDLEKMVETSDEWITTRTGIKERRIAAEEQVTSDLGVAAARQALDRAGLKPEDLDLILVATNSPDTLFPPPPAGSRKSWAPGKCQPSTSRPVAPVCSMV